MRWRCVPLPLGAVAFASLWAISTATAVLVPPVPSTRLATTVAPGKMHEAPSAVPPSGPRIHSARMLERSPHARAGGPDEEAVRWDRLGPRRRQRQDDADGRQGAARDEACGRDLPLRVVGVRVA